MQRNRKWGWIDRQGQIVIEPQWQRVGDFDTASMARVERFHKWGWIDRQGQIVIVPQWQFAWDFDTTGWVRVARDAKWGWINRQGQIAVEPQWEETGDFDTAGWARVRRNGKWGWIDRQGQTVIEPQWHYAWDFDTAGWAQVARERKSGWIDRQGQIVIEPQWDNYPTAIEHQGRTWYVVVSKRKSTLIRLWEKLPGWVPRPPFPEAYQESACYDSTGRMIWSSEDRFRRRLIGGACAAILVLYGVYAGIRRLRSSRRKPIPVVVSSSPSESLSCRVTPEKSEESGREGEAPAEPLR